MVCLHKPDLRDELLRRAFDIASQLFVGLEDSLGRVPAASGRQLNNYLQVVALGAERPETNQAPTSAASPRAAAAALYSRLREKQAHFPPLFLSLSLSLLSSLEAVMRRSARDASALPGRDLYVKFDRLWVELEFILSED